jgi:hypothetical protein
MIFVVHLHLLFSLTTNAHHFPPRGESSRSSMPKRLLKLQGKYLTIPDLARGGRVNFLFLVKLS